MAVNLGKAPEYVEWFATHGDFDGETVVGFYANVVPDGPGRVRPDTWVVVTNGGLYTLDVERWLVVGAKVLHKFGDH